jgi:hypothetical protein
VRRADRGKRRGQVTIDPIAQADEDPAREAGFWLRKRGAQGRIGRSPKALEPAPDVPGWRQDLHRRRPERRGSADAEQVRAVGIVERRRAERPLQRHSIARHRDRVDGQRRGHGEPVRRIESDDGQLGAGLRSTDARHDAGPRAISRRQGAPGAHRSADRSQEEAPGHEERPGPDEADGHGPSSQARPGRSQGDARDDAA